MNERANKTRLIFSFSQKLFYFFLTGCFCIQLEHSKEHHSLRANRKSIHNDWLNISVLRIYFCFFLMFVQIMFVVVLWSKQELPHHSHSSTICSEFQFTVVAHMQIVLELFSHFFCSKKVIKFCLSVCISPY